MKINGLLRPFLLSVCVVLTTTTAGFAKPHANIRREFTVSVDLVAPVGSTSTASGLVEFKSRQKHHSERLECEITTAGLAAGTYSIDATDSLGAAIHLGEFTATADNPATRTHENETEFDLPEAVDPLDLETVTVSDATATVVLTGDPATTRMRFHANVPVTAPPIVVTTTTEDQFSTNKHGNSHGKRVHGHALASSIIRSEVETQRHFLFVAFGAPSSTELTVKIDDVAVGTVTSTKQGKVMFKSLPETVVLGAMSLITITDATGAVVMQAEF